MDVLKENFEIYRDVIITDLDVNSELLRVMMEKGLIDAAESAKYKAMDDAHRRNEELMSAMTERRTDRAYPLFLDCLRQSGQDRIADLLTDVTQDKGVPEHDPMSSTSVPIPVAVESIATPPPSVSPEMAPLREVHTRLRVELNDFRDFLETEERRLGIPTQDGTSENKGTTSASPDNSGKQFWKDLENTMTRIITEIDRCQKIIKKLHQNCDTVADLNSEIMRETKETDTMVREILRMHRVSFSDVPVPNRTLDLFSVLQEDIRALSEGRRRVMVREEETRSNSMRLLRLCRDKLSERCQILGHINSFTASPARFSNPQSSTRLSVNSSTSTSLLLSPTESRSSDRRSLFDAQPVLSVSHGIRLLESQIIEYVHLETLLTDKLKSELRMKHLQKKAQGYTSKGFYNVKQYLDSIQHGVEVEENVERLKSVFSKLAEEYDQSVYYMKKVTSTMPKTCDISITVENQAHQSNFKSESKPRFSIFRKKPKESLVPLQLPRLVPEQTFSNLNPDDSVRGKPLLNKLKIFVANYESAKSSEKILSQKFQDDLDRKKKELTEIIRKKDDDILKLHFRLKEMTADRDKFRKLYEQVKMTQGRKG